MPWRSARRLRKNYGWIFAIQVTSYIGKLAIHPEPIASLQELWARAAIGPISGPFVLLAGLLFHASWVAIAVLTMRSGRGKRLPRIHPEEDHVLALARETA